MEHNFKLNDKEIKNFEKWEKSLPQLQKNIKYSFWYKFTPTGIGDAITVGRTDIPEYDKNITDYDAW